MEQCKGQGAEPDPIRDRFVHAILTGGAQVDQDENPDLTCSLKGQRMLVSKP